MKGYLRSVKCGNCGTYRMKRDNIIDKGKGNYPLTYSKK